jgi:hypothetical protein
MKNRGDVWRRRSSDARRIQPALSDPRPFERSERNLALRDREPAADKVVQAGAASLAVFEQPFPAVLVNTSVRRADHTLAHRWRAWDKRNGTSRGD